MFVSYQQYEAWVGTVRDADKRHLLIPENVQTQSEGGETWVQIASPKAK